MFKSLLTYIDIWFNRKLDKFCGIPLIPEDTPNPYIGKYGFWTWHKNGFKHREDGPAVHDGNNVWNEWWLNGRRHRIGGPAVYGNYLPNQYWVHGKMHREDGPARIYNDGTKTWWLKGKQYTPNEWIKKAPFKTEEERVLFKLQHM